MPDTTDRVAREQAAYDEGDVKQQNARLQGRFRHVFTCPNSQRAEDRLAELTQAWSRGADVLDYGCYDGLLSEQIARYAPASITGIDISRTAIAEAQDKRGHLGTFHVMDAMNTDFDDASFDLIVGRAILHHLDWEKALDEIGRILRPDGHVVFMEPLGDNPAAKLYRALTPKARTADETPLSRSQIRYGDELFGTGEHTYVNLLSTPLGMLSSLVLKRPDNAMMRMADAFDRAAARTPMRYWMRMVLLAWTKTT